MHRRFAPSARIQRDVFSGSAAWKGAARVSGAVSLSLALFVLAAMVSPSSRGQTTPNRARPAHLARPTPGASVIARYGAAVVSIVWKNERSQGFFVSSEGVLCTVLPGAHMGDDVLVQLSDADAQQSTGKIAIIDDDGLALVVVATPTGGPRTALGVNGAPRRGGQWVLGLVRDAGPVVRAVFGDVIHDKTTRWQLLLPVPRGTAVLDARNEVMAIATEARGAGVVHALPAARIVALAARLRASPTTHLEGAGVAQPTSGARL
jgi:hypothetical protein